MLVLGVESSCDETSAAILRVKKSSRRTTPEDIEILSNIVSSQIPIHARYGGVIPEVAARKHVEAIIPVIREALEEAQCSQHDIEAIAVTNGPGLITSLRVGVEAAKILAYILRVPLVPVNHIEGHIYSNWLQPVGIEGKTQNAPKQSKSRRSRVSSMESGLATGQAPHKIIAFPALVLVVSGGHTELVLMRDHGKYEIIGKTRDDAVGEAFDKVAKILGLGYPGGPAVSALAETSNLYPLPYTLKLPRPMIESKDFDFSFAGLKTAVLYCVRDLTKKYSLQEIAPAIAYEFQNAAVEVLVEKTLRTMETYTIRSVLLAGGVSANKKLRQDLGVAMGTQPGITYIQPNLAYTGDNAAMIAVAGYFNYVRAPKKYRDGWRKVEVSPNLSL